MSVVGSILHLFPVGKPFPVIVLNFAFIYVKRILSCIYKAFCTSGWISLPERQLCCLASCVFVEEEAEC